MIYKLISPRKAIAENSPRTEILSAKEMRAQVILEMASQLALLDERLLAPIHRAEEALARVILEMASQLVLLVVGLFAPIHRTEEALT
jgi:hypothetical protein